MNASFQRWFLGGALFVAGLHVGEAFSLLFDGDDTAVTRTLAVVVEDGSFGSRS